MAGNKKLFKYITAAVIGGAVFVCFGFGCQIGLIGAVGDGGINNIFAAFLSQVLVWAYRCIFFPVGYIAYCASTPDSKLLFGIIFFLDGALWALFIRGIFVILFRRMSWLRSTRGAPGPKGSDLSC